jgi:hypothetical protein
MALDGPPVTDENGWLRPVHVGCAWCCEPVSKWDAEASGTQNCCCEHEIQTRL